MHFHNLSSVTTQQPFTQQEMSTNAMCFQLEKCVITIELKKDKPPISSVTLTFNP